MSSFIEKKIEEFEERLSLKINPENVRPLPGLSLTETKQLMEKAFNKPILDFIRQAIKERDEEWKEKMKFEPYPEHAHDGEGDFGAGLESERGNMIDEIEKRIKEME